MGPLGDTQGLNRLVEEKAAPRHSALATGLAALWAPREGAMSSRGGTQGQNLQTEAKQELCRRTLQDFGRLEGGYALARWHIHVEPEPSEEDQSSHRLPWP